MKKALKISAYTLLGIIILMVILPFAFKGKIKEQVQKEMNNSLNAKVSFDGVGLSLFSHFPDMTLKIKNLQIIGVNDFSKDTLADIPSFSVTLGLWSVVKGSEYQVKQILLDSPHILLKVLKDGKVNWDITKPSTDTTATAPASAFKVKLNKIKVTNANFVYDDAETPMVFSMKGMSGVLGGDMTADKTNLDIDATVDDLMVEYDHVRYLNKIKASLKTSLGADLAGWVFTFRQAEMKMNDLTLAADGTFGMPEDGYDMDIKFAAKENTFKAFLSLIPAIYAKDFSSLKTEGTLAFDGFVKGKYTDLLIPAFALNIKISNGMFAYPSLPGNVSEVNMIAGITNPDGNTDHTVIDVPKLHLKMMKNPVDAVFTLKTPVSDPDIKGSIKGMIDLANVAAIYPLGDKTSLSGTIDADIQLNGKMSSIEKQQYQDFDAKGYALMSGIKYSSPDLPQAVDVSSARMDFSPAFISLSGMKMSIGKNDIAANGKIENYLPYFLKDNSILKGNLDIASNYMDVNSLVSGSEPSTTTTDTSALAVIEIPANIDFTLSSRFGTLLYDTYNMKNAGGIVRIKDQTLFLDGLRVEMLGGSMEVNGSYNTFNPEKPKVDMKLKVTEIDVKDAFKTFSTVQAFAPIAERLNGKITTNLSFNGNLKPDMMPELVSLSGAGLLLSNLLSVDNLNTFNVIADVLKIEKLRKPAIEKVNLSFDLVDGKATIKPMDFKLASFKSNFSGTIGLDKALNLILNLEIPRSEFGGKANGVLNGLVSDASAKGLKVNVGDMVPVTLLIGGTVTDPKVTAGIKQALSGVVEDLKQQAIAQVQQKKEEVVAKAKQEANKLIDQADAQAQRVLALAQQQSDAVLKTATLSAAKLRSQADSAAGKILAEGKKNGMIAEIAAKKTAEKVKKEADVKATKLTDEAKAKSDALLNKARQEAEQLKQQARSGVK